MAFAQFPQQQQVVQLLQRSLERGRLGHAYLFSGDSLEELQAVAETLAKTLNCSEPSRGRLGQGHAVDCCDRCSSCRRIHEALHPDIQWIRPESKSRVVRIEQIRDLLQSFHLKPAEAQYKVAIIVAADRMNEQAANAFLKTLEEPPTRSILVLISTNPQRLLETIVSRCLRLHFAGTAGAKADPAHLEWLAAFAKAAVAEKSLLGRYRLLGGLLARLAKLKEGIEEDLNTRSPLNKYDDLDPDLREKWEDELSAAVEAEYRRQRGEILTTLEWWLRDVWLRTLETGAELCSFPQLAEEAAGVARRLTTEDALRNLITLERTQTLLHTNVQEALALEVAFLKLKLG